MPSRYSSMPFPWQDQHMFLHSSALLFAGTSNQTSRNKSPQPKQWQGCSKQNICIALLSTAVPLQGVSIYIALLSASIPFLEGQVLLVCSAARRVLVFALSSAIIHRNSSATLHRVGFGEKFLRWPLSHPLHAAQCSSLLINAAHRAVHVW